MGGPYLGAAAVGAGDVPAARLAADRTLKVGQRTFTPGWMQLTPRLLSTLETKT